MDSTAELLHRIRANLGWLTLTLAEPGPDGQPPALTKDGMMPLGNALLTVKYLTDTINAVLELPRD